LPAIGRVKLGRRRKLNRSGPVKRDQLGLVERDPAEQPNRKVKIVDALPKQGFGLADFPMKPDAAIGGHAGEDSMIGRGRSRTGYSRRSPGLPWPPMPANSASASAISRR
jgi:hypothetical protein